ncbi:hypothetical protein PR003_g21797 [Phytophthora rubi]|uniref:Uncharacterized protein n=1 Tax=Phytophthora rubi TaxID=129364 RepID=A0A6A3J807_9STRA|nr:hypothetical protein PR002_g21138 [Phytophthora rubi]KAE8993621.1 hypothetical protein PR001_g20622 [Phytophthora rubi]KAE9304238.1 hypothetical protein PR003_g21797 [Phytophthora rubi]
MATYVAAEVPTSEPKTLIHADGYAEPQAFDLGDDKDDADGMLLHLIRTIVLYLFVFLSQTAKLAVTDAELAVFAADAATPDLLDAQTEELQRRLHAALFAWVQSEVNSNQFDGLLQEQRAFVVIKRLFRQQHAKAAAQCRVLAALLNSYLARLETPLVHCEPSSMLSSTLQYLLAKEKDAKNEEPVPLPMLYPLVNAVDLVSIEQRECLDALMNLLRWLTAHDQSQTVLATFTNKYHVKVIGMEKDSGDSSMNRNDGNEISNEALGVCFVQTLLRYSDHIFRRDLQFEDMVPTLSYSDTEDDDVSSEDGCTQNRHKSSHDLKQISDNLSAAEFEEPTNTAKADANVADEVTSVPPELPESPQVDKNYEASVLNDGTKSVAVPSKGVSRSLRKRKKREERVMTVPAKASRRANKSRAKPICDPVQQLLLGQEWENEEPLPAVVCFGIAAAAGTLAAMLCVYLN